MGHETMTITNTTTTLVFTYGTLKRGFSNHVLMQDLIRSGDATFKGVYKTVDKYPLVCGPYRVPFLLNKPGSGNHHVTGELYAVSPRGLNRLDELEGITRGHYVRQPIRLATEKSDLGIDDDDTTSSCGVEAYYAHKSYEEELYERNRGRSFGEYTEKEARGYVKRNDRPQHLSFLDHIRIFVSTPCD